MSIAEHEIEQRFTWPKCVSDDQAERCALISATAKGFAKVIIAHCPESRERSLALTKLEEVVSWATSSIGINE